MRTKQYWSVVGSCVVRFLDPVVADKPPSVRGHMTDFDISDAQTGIYDAATVSLDTTVNSNNKMTELEAVSAKPI